MNTIVGTDATGLGFLALILEPGNIFKLCQKQQPIQLRIEDFYPDGIPSKLLLRIHYSETPIADAKALAPDAGVVFDERAAVTDKIRPHCPECHSTIEQLGVWRGDSPIAIAFCAICGSVFGVLPERELPANLGKEKP